MKQKISVLLFSTLFLTGCQSLLPEKETAGDWVKTDFITETGEYLQRTNLNILTVINTAKSEELQKALEEGGEKSLGAHALLYAKEHGSPVIIQSTKITGKYTDSHRVYTPASAPQIYSAIDANPGDSVEFLEADIRDLPPGSPTTADYSPRLYYYRVTESLENGYTGFATQENGQKILHPCEKRMELIEEMKSKASYFDPLYLEEEYALSEGYEICEDPAWIVTAVAPHKVSETISDIQNGLVLASSGVSEEADIRLDDGKVVSITFPIALQAGDRIAWSFNRWGKLVYYEVLEPKAQQTISLFSSDDSPLYYHVEDCDYQTPGFYVRSVLEEIRDDYAVPCTEIFNEE